MLVERAAHLDAMIRPFLVQYFPEFSTKLYSNMRQSFLNSFVNSKPEKVYSDFFPQRKIWDIEFSNNIFNSAGMFKNGEGYELAYRQGAGAFLAGTTTYLPRAGNEKNGVIHPFIPLPKSKAAINWMGLPNDGHQRIASVLSKIEKKVACPLGVSISSDPDIDEDTALKNLIEGFELYSKANVDFIELNESCPNVNHHQCETNNGIDLALIKRLEFINSNFLRKRQRNLPVIVKFSVETEIEQVPKLLKLLIDLDFDGINFGNTAKLYSNYLPLINSTETAPYQAFTSTFGGGVSGNPLKQLSLDCCKISVNERNKLHLSKEFAIVRTGGIETYNDLLESERIGIDLNQWFTGYFELFSIFGHKLYKELAENGKR
ncbi:MAG TPA: hypothetical protein PLE30_07375 [Candidatus Kapabacteria bacterium]|nr:hypothetical protein [Candidatus Kapabacteria bacterium]